MASHCSRVTTWTLPLLHTHSLHSSPPDPQTNPKGSRAARAGVSRRQVILGSSSHRVSSASPSSSSESASLARCVFAHVYYSLCSQIARPCCVLNIKCSGYRAWCGCTLSLQIESESKILGLMICTATSVGTGACAECISGEVLRAEYVTGVVAIVDWTLSSPFSSIYEDQLGFCQKAQIFSPHWIKVEWKADRHHEDVLITLDPPYRHCTVRRRPPHWLVGGVILNGAFWNIETLNSHKCFTACWLCWHYSCFTIAWRVV